MIYRTTIRIFIFFLGSISFNLGWSQEDLDALLNELDPLPPQEVIATFKSGKIINLHTVERVAAGNLEMRISHRFGRIDGGAYTLWGIDQATIRIGLDYGVSDKLAIGFGRNSYKKIYDGFFKYSVTKQKKNGFPISVVAISSIAIKSLRFSDPGRDNYFRSRLSYVHQLVLARKFTSRLSLEVVPSWVHFNLVSSASDQSDIPVLAAGGRMKVSKRVSINAEYGYRIQLNDDAANINDFYDSFSVGVDIETGGHVFQLQFTNSLPMFEMGFLAQTNDRWSEGGIHFGFNITREFVLKH
ncbi:MAG: DUF5777 family beta-barrel protein [Gammaproteobacteria bacterium]|jgi:hypothetical protein|tara:strand:- start:406 stop:1302 length:897 start_codon:yes stop_codon:yes gene_type:complete